MTLNIGAAMEAFTLIATLLREILATHVPLIMVEAAGIAIKFRMRCF